ncbi:MAG: zinc-ribbon domain-containing protein [Polyangiaceae bacterium]
MKITCQACQAKYTIADDKVVGKVVRIRCKKCGATIVVNGNDASASSTTAAAPDLPAAEDAGDGTEGWTVNVSEGDQRTMNDAAVIAAYRSHVIDDETYCWKEGMADWAPLREIPELYDACSGAIGPAGAAPAKAEGEPDEKAARAKGFFARSVVTSATATGQNGAGGTAGPVAARRIGGRAPAADLFSGVAKAGGDEDVMTSAPAKMPAPHEDAQRLTGARNENSVLFSLPTMTGKSNRPPPPPDSEASGLIDIRQLSAQIATGDVESKRRNSRVDDIMNLSGGGAFSPTLTAPALAPPTVETTSDAPGLGNLLPAFKSRRLIALAVGAGALVVLAAVGGAVAMMHGKADEVAARDKPRSSPSAAEMTPTQGTAGANPLAAAPSPPGETPSATVRGVAAAPAQPAPAEPPEARPEARPEVREGKPAALAGGPSRGTSAPSPHGAAAESDQPFNMGEARARLAAVAGAVQSCKKPSGPTGTGRVIVVFGPSGAVQSASIEGEPFAGTATGGCVAAHFRAVRVPAFGGSPFSVKKSFSIN